MIIHKLKNYLEDNGFSSEGIEIDEDNKHNIKVNFQKLAESYVILFNEFIRIFKGCADAQELITKNKPIAEGLIRLLNEKKQGVKFGSGKTIRSIDTSVRKDYINICEFFDISCGVLLE